MAQITRTGDTAIRITVTLEDALAMIREAARHRILDDDPKQYLSLTLDAPDAFFYVLYGGMAGLYEMLRQERKTCAAAEEAGSPAGGGVQA